MDLESPIGPSLRFDIKIRRSATDPSHVVADDLATNRQHRMSEVECLIAQHMDGSMTVADLVELAREADPTWTSVRVQGFIDRLAALGLLQGVAPTPAADDDDFDEEFGADATVAPVSVPRLRFDLRIRSHDLEPDSMRIEDPRSGAAHVFSTVECLLAQHMDGERTSEDLLEIAQAHDPSWERAQVDGLIDRLAVLGLFSMADEDEPADAANAFTNVEQLEEVEVDELDSSALVPALPPSLGPLYPEDQEKTNVADVRESGIFQLLNGPHAQPAQDPAEVEDAKVTPLWSEGDTKETPEAAFAEPGLGDTPPPAEKALMIPEPDEAWDSAPLIPSQMQPVAEQVSKLPVSPTVSDQESELERPPWYTRAWVRRVRVPAIAVGLLGALAIFPYPRYVTEECNVLPLSRVEVRAQVDGIIAEILADEGDEVLKGQVVARLDDGDLKSSIQQAQADVARLTAKVEKMRGGSRPEEIARARSLVAAARNNVKFARIAAVRAQRLFSQGVGSAELRDKAKRDLELKSAALSQARAELRLMEAGFRVEEIKVAEAELDGAEAELERLQNKQEHVTIRSPIAGQILTPKFKERLHEKVTAGDSICEIANTSQVRVEILVPEREIDSVRRGQETVVKVQALPLHPFEGKVDFIAPTVEEEGEKRFIRVVTVIDNSEGVLQEGMTGYGEIDTGKSTLLKLALRRIIRWVRVRFLI